MKALFYDLTLNKYIKLVWNKGQEEKFKTTIKTLNKARENGKIEIVYIEGVNA